VKQANGAKEDESSIEGFWAAGFYHVTAISRLAHFLKIINPLFLSFSNLIYLRGAVLW
jgi:hypothetical protein